MSQNQPVFSVVIPCYNRAHSIRPTLELVAGQTFRDFECIVVDDGSEDGAALQEVVDSLGDPRFRVIRRPNGGGGAARNTGFDAARGRWVALLDSDDNFLPGKLEAFLPAVTRAPDAVWYSPALVDRGSGRMWVRPARGIAEGEDVGDYLFVHNQFIPTPTIVLPRSLARRVRFDPTLPKQQDLDFAVRLQAAGARFKMLETPQVVWNDRGEDDRVSRNRGAEAPELLLDRLKPLLSPNAIRGYRSTVLAYYLADQHPMRALRYIAEGFLLGGVGLRVTLRQLLRATLPRSIYRRIVDRFVFFFGRRS